MHMHNQRSCMKEEAKNKQRMKGLLEKLEKVMLQSFSSTHHIQIL